MSKKRGAELGFKLLLILITHVLIFMIFLSAISIAAEIKIPKTNNETNNYNTNSYIKIAYPIAGVYTPNSGTYQPYKNIKAHFIIPNIKFSDTIASEGINKAGVNNRNPVEEYELYESGYNIGRYKTVDTEPNTAIITNYGLHSLEIIGYDKDNKTIAKENVEFYAGFNYEDRYAIIKESPTAEIANKVTEEDTKKLNISYDDYETSVKEIKIEKNYSYVTAADKLTNNTVEHTKITIKIILDDKNIDSALNSQIIICELYPKSILNELSSLLLSDEFIIIQKNKQYIENSKSKDASEMTDTIIAWKEDNLLPFQKEIIKTYYINKRLEQKNIEEIHTIIINETQKSNRILWLIMISLIIIAIIISSLFYYRAYKKNKHKIEVYDIDKKNNEINKNDTN